MCVGDADGHACPGRVAGTVEQQMLLLHLKHTQEEMALELSNAKKHMARFIDRTVHSRSP